MKTISRAFPISPLAIALVIAACGEKTPELPVEPVDRAATCGVVAAASERETFGAKGNLPADAQARILHYAMLYASNGQSFDQSKVATVSKRMPTLFDQTIRGKWKNLRPACGNAFPATQITQPVLPAKPLDSMLECYALVDFLRKALAEQGAGYVQATGNYAAFRDRLDIKMTPVLRAAGLTNGEALQDRRAQALAAATKLGQPPAVVAACEKQYPAR